MAVQPTVKENTSNPWTSVNITSEAKKLWHEEVKVAFEGLRRNRNREEIDTVKLGVFFFLLGTMSLKIRNA